MQPGNMGLCRICRRSVPAHYVITDNKVWLCKQCPECGQTQTLASNDAATWQRKRTMWGYDASAPINCGLNCGQCNRDHKPSIVFVDVTNRCNMNCPICIVNIKGMGYEFHPPMAYFEKIFRHLATFDPVPMVELFGGEPTVRSDLLDIIKLGRDFGLRPRVVTNGLRLADETYCKKLCDEGVRFRLGFDGRDPTIYERLRKNPNVYAKKLKSLENLSRFSRRKNAILTCAAKGINDDKMADLIACCHEYRHVIDELGLIPLAEMWDPGTFEEGHTTTPEDVEHMIERSVPGGNVEFVPAGIAASLRRARSFLKRKARSETLMLGGVHPNCEAMTVLVSTGREYRSANEYLRVPMSRLATEILQRSRRIEAKLARLDPDRRLDRWRGQLLLLRTFGPLALRTVDVMRVLRARPLSTWLRILVGLLRGRKLRTLVNAYADPPHILRIATLPFEELHAIDSARLENCKAAFAYEDATDGRIKLIPTCIWTHFQKDVLGKVAAKYGTAQPAEAVTA